MSIEQNNGRFVVPCREWASVHLGLDLPYSYKTKRNAVRAMQRDSTRLCHYMQRCYARVCALEIILCRAKKELDSYALNVPDTLSCGDSESGDTGASESGAGAGDDCVDTAETTA